MTITSVDTTKGSVNRAEIENFLFEEAALLDDWRLTEWLENIHEDAYYLVPSPSARDGNRKTDLFLVADDRPTLISRVRQLLGRTNWAASPRPRTRRLVTNVRILTDDGNEITVTANFSIWHYQHNQADVYVGKYVHTLVRTTEGLRFLERKAVLDLETLRPHGKIAIIL